MAHAAHGGMRIFSIVEIDFDPTLALFAIRCRRLLLHRRLTGNYAVVGEKSRLQSMTGGQ